MALKMNYNKEAFGQTITLNNAYIKITCLTGNKDNLSITATILTNDKNIVIDEFIYGFVPSVEDISANFIKQSYEYLKTLDEYNDAVDC